ncbi:glycosyltransferase family 2 protein [Microbacterium resistens]
MTNPPPILLAIPTYRRTELLPPLIEVLRAEGGTVAHPTRILVVDNDPDRSAEPAAEAAGVAYLAEARPGIAAARQAALDAAAADELVVMIDDDVMPEPGWLAGLVDVWTTVRPTAVVGFVRYVWPEGTDPWIAAGGFLRRNRPPSGTLLSSLSTGSVLFDAAEMRRLGVAFDRTLGLVGGEDMLLGRDLLARGGTIAAASDSVARDEIPENRATRAFVRRRTISQGQARTAILTRDGSVLRRLAARTLALGGGVVRLAAFGTGAAVAALRRDVAANAVLRRRTWFAQGRILGAVGRITPEYARPVPAARDPREEA